MKIFNLSLILGLFASNVAAAMNIDIGRAILLNDLFEGRTTGRVEMLSFSPDFVVPTVETSSDILRVMAEIAVTDAVSTAGQHLRLFRILHTLRQKHGFVPDATFTILRQKEKPFSILPYPPAPKKPVFIVRGFIRNGALQGLQADSAVLKAWLDTKKIPAPKSKESLLKFIQKHGEKILTVASVATVELGLDCGLKDNHYHIVPHKPAVIITLDGSVARDRVLAALSAAVSQLMGISYLVTDL